MKKCPYCAEEIQDEAIVCRYCGRDLPEPTLPDEKPFNKNESINLQPATLIKPPAPTSTTSKEVITPKAKPVDKDKEFDKYVRKEVVKQHKLASYWGQMILGIISAIVGFVFLVINLLTPPSNSTCNVFCIGMIIVGILFFINGGTALLIHRK